MISSPVKQKILLLLLAGTTLGLTRSPRRYFQIAKSLPRAWRQIDRDYLWRTVKEFRHHRLLDWTEHADGTISMVLTEKGRRMAGRFDPDKLSIPKPNRWDKKWRIVIYDIPQNKKGARDALRHELQVMGFKEWQKSVFIHPYPGHEQIDFIIELFELRPYVRQAEVFNPTNEAELKLYFGLV